MSVFRESKPDEKPFQFRRKGGAGLGALLSGMVKAITGSRSEPEKKKRRSPQGLHASMTARQIGEREKQERAPRLNADRRRKPVQTGATYRGRDGISSRVARMLKNEAGLRALALPVEKRATAIEGFYREFRAEWMGLSHRERGGYVRRLSLTRPYAYGTATTAEAA